MWVYYDNEKCYRVSMQTESLDIEYTDSWSSFQGSVISIITVIA